MVKQELKETIGSLAVMLAIETEPKRLHEITRSFINWIKCGLIESQNDTTDIERLKSEFELGKGNQKEIVRTALAVAINNDLIDCPELAKLRGMYGCL